MSDRPAQHSALNARDDLLAIADTWPDLLDRLGKEGRAGGEKVSGTKTPGLVINERVSDVMAEIRQWVHFLVRVLMEEVTIEHRWTEADDDGNETERVQVAPWEPHDTTPDGLLREIARERIGHFTEHEDEGLRLAFYDDARELRRKAERTAYPRGVKNIPLHIACVEHGTTDLGERVACCGQYMVRLDPEKAGLIPDMVCDQDSTHRITPEQWQRAARKTSFDPAGMRRLLGAVVGG